MYKLIKIITLSLIFCIVFITGCSKSDSTTINEIKFDNIKSARIELATVGASTSKTYTFDFNNSKQTKIIEDVIKYLRSGKVQGYSDEKVSEKGGSPTFLILVLKDGSVIRIKSAVRETITKGSTGATEISHFDIPNEVTVNINSNEKPIRILSPEIIRKLIESGYKDIFLN